MAFSDSLTNSKVDQLAVLYTSLLHEADKRARLDIADEIKTLFAHLTAPDIIALDNQLSRSRYDYNHPRQSSEKIIEDTADENVRFALLCLGTFHPDGHYREKCMHLLSSYGSKALPFIVLLINNWVEPIRVAAFDITRALVEQANAKELIQCFVCFDKVRQGNRRDSARYQKLYDLIRGRIAEQLDTVSSVFINEQTIKVRRLFYESMALQNLPETLWLQMLSKEQDSFNKLLIARFLLNQASLSVAAQDQLKHHRVATIRYVVLRHLYAQGAYWEDAHDYLMDPNRSIRQFTRFCLTRQGQTDFITAYTQKLQHQPDPVALLGLAEVGHAVHIPLIKTFLQECSSPQMIRAAITALGKLDSNVAPDLYYSYIVQDDRGCAKSAFDIIKHRYIRYPAIRSYEDLITTSYEHSRQYLYQILMMAPPWERLSYQLKLMRASDSQRQGQIQQDILAWRPGFTEPANEEIVLVRDTLLHTHTSQDMWRHLAFAVKPYIQLEENGR